MPRTIADPRALTYPQLRRAGLCGATVPAWRLSGKAVDLPYLCGQRWCHRCAGRYANRAFAKIMEALEHEEGDSQVFFVTITRRARPGLTAEDLQDAVDRDRAHWRAIRQRLDWDDNALRKDTAAARRYLRHHGLRPATIKQCRPGRPGQCEPFDEAYDEATGYWPAADGDLTYIWGLEATIGSKGQHWHVHRHIICPDRATAERIVAAAGRHRDPIQGKSAYVVDILAIDREKAAGYIASEISGMNAKSGSWESQIRAMPLGAQKAYVEGLRHVRRYDAAGRWRPLGMGRKKSEDPVVLVQQSADEVVDAARFYALPWRSRTGDELQPAGDGKHAHDRTESQCGCGPTATTSCRPCSGIEHSLSDGRKDLPPDLVKAVYDSGQSVYLTRARPPD